MNLGYRGSNPIEWQGGGLEPCVKEFVLSAIFQDFCSTKLHLVSYKADSAKYSNEVHELIIKNTCQNQPIRSVD